MTALTPAPSPEAGALPFERLLAAYTHELEELHSIELPPVDDPLYGTEEGAELLHHFRTAQDDVFKAEAVLVYHVATLTAALAQRERELAEARAEIRKAENYMGGRGIIRLTGDEEYPRRTLSEMIIRLEDKMRAETLRESAHG